VCLDPKAQKAQNPIKANGSPFPVRFRANRSDVSKNGFVNVLPLVLSQPSQISWVHRPSTVIEWAFRSRCLPDTTLWFPNRRFSPLACLLVVFWLNLSLLFSQSIEQISPLAWPWHHSIGKELPMSLERDTLKSTPVRISRNALTTISCHQFAVWPLFSSFLNGFGKAPQLRGIPLKIITGAALKTCRQTNSDQPLEFGLETTPDNRIGCD